MPTRLRPNPVAVNEFRRKQRAEEQFAKPLRSLARYCGMMTQHMHDDNDIEKSSKKVHRQLTKYAETIRPWAETVATKMVMDIVRRDNTSWSKYGQSLGRNLRAEVAGAPTNALIRKHIKETTDYILNIPLAAAERVQTQAAHAASGRLTDDEVSENILRAGAVAKSHANTIARTQVMTIATDIARARSIHLGATKYRWMTMRDNKVRHEHKLLAGTVCSWDDPPIAGPNGQRAHPGQMPNCRCYPELLIPDAASTQDKRPALVDRGTCRPSCEEIAPVGSPLPRWAQFVNKAGGHPSSYHGGGHPSF